MGLRKSRPANHRQRRAQDNDRRMKAHIADDTNAPLRSVSRLQKIGHAGKTRGERLLDQDVAAGLQRRRRQWQMMPMGHGDHHGVGFCRKTLFDRLADFRPDPARDSRSLRGINSATETVPKRAALTA